MIILALLALIATGAYAQCTHGTVDPVNGCVCWDYSSYYGPHCDQPCTGLCHGRGQCKCTVWDSHQQGSSLPICLQVEADKCDCWDSAHWGGDHCDVSVVTTPAPDCVYGVKDTNGHCNCIVGDLSDGFYGDRCQYSCQNDLCHGRGGCQCTARDPVTGDCTAIDSTKCDCWNTNVWSGDHCDVPTPLVCDHGTKVCVGANCHCVCATGYSGDKCQYSWVDPSLPACVNGYYSGTQPHLTCTCVNGWTGTACDHAPTCHNGGALDTATGTYCACAGLWMGVTCETAIVPTCLNGGVFVPAVGTVGHTGYVPDHCECCPATPGQPCAWTGATCADHQCNWGVWSSTLGKCNCIAGFTGTRCDQDCLAACNGQGTVCGDTPGVCSCFPGFAGTHCETTVYSSSDDQSYWLALNIPRSWPGWEAYVDDPTNPAQLICTVSTNLRCYPYRIHVGPSPATCEDRSVPHHTGDSFALAADNVKTCDYYGGFCLGDMHCRCCQCQWSTPVWGELESGCVPAKMQYTMAAAEFHLYVNNHKILDSTDGLFHVHTVSVQPGVNQIAVSATVRTGYPTGLLADLLLNGDMQYGTTSEWLVSTVNENDANGKAWTAAGFDDSAWVPASEIAPYKCSDLTGHPECAQGTVGHYYATSAPMLSVTPARWIWKGASQTTPTTVYFRFKVTTVVPDPAEPVYTADFRVVGVENYYLYVNGQFIGNGAYQTLGDYPKVGLLAGDNTIAILGFGSPNADISDLQGYYHCTRKGILADILVPAPAAGHVCASPLCSELVSGTAWQAANTAAPLWYKPGFTDAAHQFSAAHDVSMYGQLNPDFEFGPMADYLCPSRTFQSLPCSPAHWIWGSDQASVSGYTRMVYNLPPTMPTTAQVDLALACRWRCEVYVNGLFYGNPEGEQHPWTMLEKFRVPLHDGHNVVAVKVFSGKSVTTPLGEAFTPNYRYGWLGVATVSKTSYKSVTVPTGSANCIYAGTGNNAMTCPQNGWLMWRDTTSLPPASWNTVDDAHSTSAGWGLPDLINTGNCNQFDQGGFNQNQEMLCQLLNYETVTTQHDVYVSSYTCSPNNEKYLWNNALNNQNVEQVAYYVLPVDVASTSHRRLSTAHEARRDAASGLVTGAATLSIKIAAADVPAGGVPVFTTLDGHKMGTYDPATETLTTTLTAPADLQVVAVPLTTDVTPPTTGAGAMAVLSMACLLLAALLL